MPPLFLKDEKNNSEIFGKCRFYPCLCEYETGVGINEWNVKDHHIRSKFL